jgi:hypothetical protein
MFKSRGVYVVINDRFKLEIARTTRLSDAKSAARVDASRPLKWRKVIVNNKTTYYSDDNYTIRLETVDVE